MQSAPSASVETRSVRAAMSVPAEQPTPSLTIQHRTLSNSKRPPSANSGHLTSASLPYASKKKVINARRVPELMTANFPQVELVKLEWVNVLEADETIRSSALNALIGEFIHADDIIVEVSRKLGDLKSRTR